jgi:hypothetical protein
MSPARRLRPETRAMIRTLFRRLDYPVLGRIYCDEGGDAFWKAKRRPCQRLGIKLAEVLRGRLREGGRSLYVGAGVAELPALAMETMELGRTVTACNLRADEVAVLNRACHDAPFRFIHQDAGEADGTYDHLWIVSALNDPERFPELSALSYGRANPLLFDTAAFAKEREDVVSLTARCLRRLQLPSLVTTSTEEINWITDWCLKRNISCVVEPKSYPTAVVEDPVCFILVGDRNRRKVITS